MTLPGGYSIRSATPEDAAVIAAQRGQMFVDMGTLTAEAVVQEQEVWAGWFRSALPAGEYAGFLVEYGEQVVGGVGLMFMPKIPTSKDPAVLKGHILNMSVAPEHRRRGLAEALMQAALNELRGRGIRTVNLNAAPMGKSIYERLGFIEASNPEMRLMLEEM